MNHSVIGIDCGSAACKGVLWSEGRIDHYTMVPTGWSPRQSAESVVEELLARGGIARENIPVVCTGYGRKAVDFAALSVTEITCHGMGAEQLLPGVRTVVDIGGQDCKAISVRKGKVLAFQMNDKCAAGTGRFLEKTAIQLGVEPANFQALLSAGESCTIGSMCAVFAESEIVSLISSGVSREAIAGGVVNAVAARASALAARIALHSPILFTGGLSSQTGLRTALADKLGQPVETADLAQYAGAIGAAVLGERKLFGAMTRSDQP